MSDNNADYNGSGQDEYFATNDSTQADYRQSQDGYNQPASQPHNPDPYASQQPVQDMPRVRRATTSPAVRMAMVSHMVSRLLTVRPSPHMARPLPLTAATQLRNLHSPSTASDVRTYGLRTIGADPYYQEPTQPQYTQSAYNQPPTYAQQTYYQATQQQPGYGYAQKSKIVAGLLGLFLGTLGVHNFYLGYTGKAVAQLLLTLIGWIIFIGPIISGIWALIEAVLILCSSYGSNWHRDGRGQELQD